MPKTVQERFQEIVNKYEKSDAPKIKDTIDMLAKKGIGNGVYQDYTMLCDVLEVLSIFECAVEEREV